MPKRRNSRGEIRRAGWWQIIVRQLRTFRAEKCPLRNGRSFKKSRTRRWGKYSMNGRKLACTRDSFLAQLGRNGRRLKSDSSSARARTKLMLMSYQFPVGMELTRLRRAPYTRAPRADSYVSKNRKVVINAALSRPRFYSSIQALHPLHIITAINCFRAFHKTHHRTKALVWCRCDSRNFRIFWRFLKTLFWSCTWFKNLICFIVIGGNLYSDKGQKIILFFKKIFSS